MGTSRTVRSNWSSQNRIHTSDSQTWTRMLLEILEFEKLLQHQNRVSFILYMCFKNALRFHGKLSTTNTTTKSDMSQCRAQFSENETKTIRTPPLNCLYYYIHSPFIRIFTLELYLKKTPFFMIARKKN